MTEENITNEIATPLERGVKILRQALKTMPFEPGVYRMVNPKGEVLYVGKARSLKKRVVSYTFVNKLPNRLQRMVSELHHVEITTTHTETEALLLESNLIKKLQPRYNILLKDDKSYPYILISLDHQFPRISKHRGKQKIKGKYFGPFASVMAVDEAILSVQRIFQLRNCTDSYFQNRTRPCLQYDIKRCSGPCVNKISETEYTLSVNEAKDFLRGKTDKVQKAFAEKMETASNDMRYEEAAVYRDRIKLLSYVQSKQRINVTGIQNADVLAIAQVGGQTAVHAFFYRHGRNYGTQNIPLTHVKEQDLDSIMEAFLMQFYTQHEPPPLVLLNHHPVEENVIVEALREHHEKPLRFEVPKNGTKHDLVVNAEKNAQGYLERKAIENASMIRTFDEIQNLFHLEERPKRIEIYDNSHMQGSAPYGVMVVATQDGFDKSQYRKFSIKDNKPDFGGDDFAMMREVMRRRFSHMDDWGVPSLLLIDGGLGQLNAVIEVMKELDITIPVVGIAKGPDRDAGREDFYLPGKAPFKLDEKNPTLYFLQRIRDEAHRFAIGTHRAKREKNIKKSILDEIPGIGPTRKKILLQYFGSAQNVKRAGLADLTAVRGINQSTAEIIYNYFHGK